MQDVLRYRQRVKKIKGGPFALPPPVFHRLGSITWHDAYAGHSVPATQQTWKKRLQALNVCWKYRVLPALKKCAATHTRWYFFYWAVRNLLLFSSADWHSSDTSKHSTLKRHEQAWDDSNRFHTVRHGHKQDRQLTSSHSEASQNGSPSSI